MEAFKKSITHITRSPYQSLAAALIMVFTFIVSGVFALALYTSAQALTFFESKPQLIIFFEDNKSPAEITQLQQQLEQSNMVASTKFVSKQEALALYRQWYADDPLLLEMVTADILPQSLEISATQAEFLEELADIVTREPGVEDIEFQQDVVETLVAWTTAIRRIGGALIGFLIVESLLIMVTVIGMKIALRRKEIKIMQLIGATKWYVGKPFLIEGALYGLIGAFVGWLVSMVGLFAVSSALRILLIGSSFDPFNTTVMVVFFVSMLVSGVVLGLAGSYLALLRYLR